jgi:putative endonuclease
MRECFVYVMTNIRNTVLYVGVTNNIRRRVQEHREGAVEGFTKRYKCVKLVYYEVFRTAEGAIVREKQIKNWKRKWKAELVESHNPEWRDLSHAEGW